jgi:hypothetical protein
VGGVKVKADGVLVHTNLRPQLYHIYISLCSVHMQSRYQARLQTPAKEELLLQATTEHKQEPAARSFLTSSDYRSVLDRAAEK